LNILIWSVKVLESSCQKVQLVYQTLVYSLYYRTIALLRPNLEGFYKF